MSFYVNVHVSKTSYGSHITAFEDAVLTFKYVFVSFPIKLGFRVVLKKIDKFKYLNLKPCIMTEI